MRLLADVFHAFNHGHVTLLALYGAFDTIYHAILLEHCPNPLVLLTLPSSGFIHFLLTDLFLSFLVRPTCSTWGHIPYGLPPGFCSCATSLYSEYCGSGWDSPPGMIRHISMPTICKPSFMAQGPWTDQLDSGGHLSSGLWNVLISASSQLRQDSFHMAWWPCPACQD